MQSGEGVLPVEVESLQAGEDHAVDRRQVGAAGDHAGAHVEIHIVVGAGLVLLHHLKQQIVVHPGHQLAELLLDLGGAGGGIDGGAGDEAGLHLLVEAVGEEAGAGAERAEAHFTARVIEDVVAVGKDVPEAHADQA